jgi:hypothetical protein
MGIRVNKMGPSAEEIAEGRKIAAELLEGSDEFIVIARDNDGKLNRAVFAKPATIAWASIALAKDCHTD